MDLHQILCEFKEEQDYHDYLIERRWPNGLCCPCCSSSKVCSRGNTVRFKCQSCNSSFSATCGTVFHATRLPLSKWFLAMSVILNAKKGISSLQLARTIGVNKNTAWYMQMRLRKAMKEDITLNGVVEVDETYIGGALGNMNREEKLKRNPFKSGMIHKVPVLGMVQRKGKLILQPISNANKEVLRPIIRERVNKNSTIITDGFGPYRTLNREFVHHVAINHEKKQKALGIYNLNSIEGFFTTIKRAIIGQYHTITKEHISHYLSEISFKFNNDNKDLFSLLVTKCVT